MFKFKKKKQWKEEIRVVFFLTFVWDEVAMEQIWEHGSESSFDGVFFVLLSAAGRIAIVVARQSLS